MIAPGMTISATNQTRINLLANNTSDVINGGYGFKNILGEFVLCMDSDAPTQAFFNSGFRVNSNGCIHVVAATDPTDVWIQGLRCSSLGQLVIEDAVGVSFVNGNPLTSNSVFAITLV